ncbi:MAG: acyl-CoA thioesterase [Acidimicrobiia bacterium]|nr:acyl-CoA thioesterase [Acidimicrobiia bacterium]
MSPAAAEPSPAAHQHPVNVRYLEVDSQGVVFNMWYLAYVDDAMTSFLAARGLPYAGLTDDSLDVQVVHASIDWKGSARFGDPLVVVVEPERLGTTSFTLRFTFTVADEAIVSATMVYVLIDTSAGTPRPLPDHVRAALQ